MISGQCLCGGVSFSIQLPVKWVAHCHCSQCRRAHGAAFVTWVGAEEATVSITDESQLSWFNSSAQAQRGFCRTCGSSLFFRSSRWPGELHIVRANLLGELAQLPEGHVFYGDSVSWYKVLDDLPKND